MKPQHLLHTIFSVLILAACQRPALPDDLKVNIGDAVPAFRCEYLSGVEFDSHDSHGIPTVLVFFNLDSKDFEEQLPELQRFHQINGGYSARLMLIGCDENSERIEKYWDTHHVLLPVGPGNGRREYSLFANSGIPRIFIYDKDGILCRTYGPDDRPTAESIYDFTETLEHVRLKPDTDPEPKPHQELPCW